MNARNLWSKILIVAGGIGMLVGAIDPLEGSLLILPGSGLLALGTYLSQAERPLITYRETTQDFRLVKFFHERGIPQVIHDEREFFKPSM